MKFSVGQNVVDKKSVIANNNCIVDKVLAIVDDYYITETFGSVYGEEEIHPYGSYKEGTRPWRSGLHRYTEDELLSLTEAFEELKRLEDAKDQLNKEFELVRSQVESKLSQAAKLVQEAGTIVLSHNRTFYDLKRECGPLYQSLKDGGWSHSTMQC